MCYTTLMKNSVNENSNFIKHSIRYYFVICPRYRRKIFDIPGMAQRFAELVGMYCTEQDMELCSIDFCSDGAIIQILSVPSLSPNDIMKGIRKFTSSVLREEFPVLSSMTSLWIRNYMVSTELIERSTATAFISLQKKRL